jgi:putative N6-adenine-specific DNA methylase
MSEHSLFVTCAPELESLLQEELKELGVEQTHLGYRGIYVDDWNWSTIYKINYGSRLASRVLLPLSRFKCFDRQTLYQAIFEMDWSPLFKEGRTFAIDANVTHRELRNSLFAAQVVKDAICDQLRDKVGRRPSVDVANPDIQLNLFIQNTGGMISFDTSGIPLHKRGYRQESVEAPIQESLAAAILRLAKYSSEDILLDPCCGSGTLLIEAALMATSTPPGYIRQRWGFMRHPAFNIEEWLTVRNKLDEKRSPLPANRLFGVDISKNSVRACKINLKAAGFSNGVEVVQGDFRDFEPRIAPNLIVTNPPYGNRLEDETLLRPFYRALGNFMKQKSAKPARGFIFTGNLELTKEVGLASKQRHVLSTGGMDARLLEFDIY